ncbi:MAG: substrate-binding domain-containing protein, partial [Acetatifactor sp.]|nr:substrate-binding domain-containing protein [Acetatifactor sp.]
EVINNLKKKGFRIPEDIKIVSFENGRTAELYDPGISAIEMDSALASESAVSILKDMIRNDELQKRTIRIPAVLHRRETSVSETEEELRAVCWR